MQLRIYDGIIPIRLSGDTGYIRGCTYYPISANPVTLADVVETCTVTFSGTPAQILETTRQIERMFDAARLRNEKQVQRRTYIECRPNVDGDWHRAELRWGTVDGPSDALRRRLDLTETTVQFELTWQREATWWGPLTAIPISNRTSTGTTSGLRMYNHSDSDAGQDNYADINSSKVTGTLPTPAYVEWGPPNTGKNWQQIHLINARFVGPDSFTHMHECESASGSGGRISVAAGGGVIGNIASSNAYRQVQVPAGTTAEFYWETSAVRSAITLAEGRDCRVLLRLYSHAWGGSTRPAAFVQVSLRMDNRSYILSASDEILVPNDSPKLLDLGILQMPEAGGSEVSLVVSVRTDIAITLGFDFLQIVPTDGYRVWQLGTGFVLNNQVVIDNPHDQLFYKILGDGTRTVYPAQPRGTLWLYPDKTQRVYLLADANAGMYVDYNWLLKLSYRPRRLTLD